MREGRGVLRWPKISLTHFRVREGRGGREGGREGRGGKEGRKEGGRERREGRRE